LVSALRDKTSLPPAPADEQALIDFAKELFATKRVKQETFDAAIDQFGALQLTELTTLMGYYSLLAMNANAFEIDLPENRTEPVLPV
jgi:4-carboxymuconolactone decarboxylase